MTAPGSPYLPEDIADLFPDAVTREFWDRCARHELAFQRCSACGTFRNPPVPICYACRSTETEWFPVPGHGTVFSFTIVTHAVHPDLLQKIPFNVVLVEFPEAPGVRLISNVVDAAPDDLSIGMAVRLHWDDLSDGRALPRFESA